MKPHELREYWVNDHHLILSLLSPEQWLDVLGPEKFIELCGGPERVFKALIKRMSVEQLMTLAQQILEERKGQGDSGN